MKVYLIRHGLTEGNKRKAYIGAGTDEPLCREGIAQLEAHGYPSADIVFASPMKRCLMTAERIYPGHEIVVCENLREMDFGDFEGRTYEELKNNPDYLKWLESGGESAFPGGESKEAFMLRAQNAFRECIRSIPKRMKTAAFVVHGGTIMAIMSEYGAPKGEYYKWQLANGEFVGLEVED